MIANKHITKFIFALMAVAVAICMVAVCFSDKLYDLLDGDSHVTMEYESELFDTSKNITVDIQIDEDDWDEMLENAISEEYYKCDVVINGEKITNVAIRPKGNTSLSSIASDPDTDRYSFKLEFDQYVENQTCFGLDKLILNNNYADATNMKEALIYDMYQYLGADASLYNYAQVSVNGEYWGVYLALEAVEDSFMLRNYGTQDGELYKPESMGMNGKSNVAPVNGGAPGGGGGQNGGGFSMGGNGANLNYTDDDLDSYSTIWDGEVTDTSKSDHKRVVSALKNISEGNDLETYMDVDNILKYMAVHTFAVNEDSLSGSMAHNYYLYEYDGQLNMIPWDYNLSFGGMGMGNSSATSIVNDAIDTPFSATNFFDTLLENEEYLEIYHSYLQQLAEEYIQNGGFEEFYTTTREKIDSLVETDPTAFYSYDEYNTAAETLSEVVSLRAESILGQLDGSIPSTDDGQREDSSSLIDASNIDVSVMGQMNRSDKGRPDADEDEETESNSDEITTIEGSSKNSEADDIDSESASKTESEPSQQTQPSNDSFTPPTGDMDFSNMTPPTGDMDFSNMTPPTGDMDFSNMTPPTGDMDFSNMTPPTGDMDFSNMTPPTNDSDSSDDVGASNDNKTQEGANENAKANLVTSTINLKNVATYAACLLIMLIAFIVIKLIKRRRKM